MNWTVLDAAIFLGTFSVCIAAVVVITEWLDGRRRRR